MFTFRIELFWTILFPTNVGKLIFSNNYVGQNILNNVSNNNYVCSSSSSNTLCVFIFSVIYQKKIILSFNKINTKISVYNMKKRIYRESNVKQCVCVVMRFKQLAMFLTIYAYYFNRHLGFLPVSAALIPRFLTFSLPSSSVLWCLLIK